MKAKKSSFSAFATVEEEGSGSLPHKKRSKKKSPLSKTSVDPLYQTTDQYRQVIKPMKVEDFLSKPK